MRGLTHEETGPAGMARDSSALTRGRLVRRLDGLVQRLDQAQREGRVRVWRLQEHVDRRRRVACRREGAGRQQRLERLEEGFAHPVVVAVAAGELPGGAGSS